MQAVKFRAKKNKSNGKPKEVCMLTTEGSAARIPTGKNDKDGNPIAKPACIIAYNHKIIGVDMVDQQLHSVIVVRKTYKWYKKVALRLFMTCVLCAHKLHRKFMPSTKDFLTDLKDLLVILVSSSPKLNKDVIWTDTVQRLTERHFPQKRETKAGITGYRKDKMCRACWARGLRSRAGREIRTVWICPDRPSQPGLRADQDCFKAYHTIFDYSVSPDGENGDSSDGDE
ncbi:hypothetical protein SNE40_002819 [Patella caerulea]|uniref:PiggyBac transposable element-derived protein domain-containing protein n=1 Tax=Patella caerulea TaxID=87958 RepID=A0AAN8K6P5_PATCE